MATTQTVLTGEAELPRWDLTALFPSLESPEFMDAFAQLIADTASLGDRFAAIGVGREQRRELDEALAADFSELLQALNDIETRLDEIGAYLYGLITTDSRNELAQARYSELQERTVALNKLFLRFTGWVGELPLDDLLAASPLAAAHAYPLRQLQISAGHLMSDAEEALVAELAPSAATAWRRLHGNLTSQIVAELDVAGERRSLTMSELRNLAMDADRDLRLRAWQAELAAWEGNAVPLAAALNSVKGHALVIGNRRGWADPLAEALFDNAIDQDVLDALLAEARAAFPDLRRYLRAKARAIGVPRLAWYDLFAPVGGIARSWTWLEAGDFIVAQFAAHGDRMAGLARRAFAEDWIDAGPRPGKVGGAYCMSLIAEQSRILANFSASYDGVSMLAHELGHAYHNLNLAELTPLQRRMPMTLAETASTFCETIVKEAALVDAPSAEQLYILEQSLQGSCQIVVDIISRFDFEQALIAGRRDRELAPSELTRLMLEAQAGTYGDALAGEERHGYMWAVKGHYYSAERSFYNFPYLFGLLFGLGLYARYRDNPSDFPRRYDELLAATGLASAAELATRFDIDLRSRAFWRASLDLIRADIARFESLAAS